MIDLIAAHPAITDEDAVNPRFDDLKKPEWVRGRVPVGFWDDPANQRRYVDWLGRKLGVKKLDDWYRTRVADFVANRAIKLLARHRSIRGGVAARVRLDRFRLGAAATRPTGSVPRGFRLGFRLSRLAGLLLKPLLPLGAAPLAPFPRRDGARFGPEKEPVPIEKLSLDPNQ